MTLVPLHPEQGADAQELRWIIPSGLLPMLGPIASVPQPLRAVVDEGVIASVEVAPDAVVMRLANAYSWRCEGARIRTALAAALQRVEQWRAAEGVDTSSRARLAAVAQTVLESNVGEFIRSHGGDVAVVSTSGDVLEVALGGACRDCPARDLTAKGRLEKAVRALYPELVEVRLARRR